MADYSLLSYTDDAAAIKEGKVDVGSREDGGMCVCASLIISPSDPISVLHNLEESSSNFSSNIILYS